MPAMGRQVQSTHHFDWFGWANWSSLGLVGGDLVDAKIEGQNFGGRNFNKAQPHSPKRWGTKAVKRKARVGDEWPVLCALWLITSASWFLAAGLSPAGVTRTAEVPRHGQQPGSGQGQSATPQVPAGLASVSPICFV